MASDVARLFFAAWPAPELQAALGGIAQDLKRECGGRAIPASNIHLTLVFLGNIDRGRVERIARIAAPVAAPCFELAVDRVEYWRHNRIVWAGVTQCPEPLQSLVAALERVLAPEGFRPERRPYVPHVTLLRNARRAPAVSGVAPLRWPVTRFALVESAQREKGRAYVVLRDWPLST
jgi:2'-5' RNA ligase